MSRPARNQSIDALKGIAILSVLMLHALPKWALYQSFAWFHIWQAVPVFAVLLGVTGVRTRWRPLPEYYRRRLLRLLPALVVTILLSTAFAVSLGTFAWRWTLLLGDLPATGPGNYFITLILQFVILLPLLRAGWEKNRTATIAVALVVNVAFEFAALALGADGYLYSSCVLRYLFAIMLGMWIGSGRSVAAVLPISVVYLIAHAFGWRLPIAPPDGNRRTTWRPLIRLHWCGGL